MYITSFPALSCFCRKQKLNGFMRVLNERNGFFFYRGAFAVYHAIKLLKLPPEATVLVPAYHCGVEIEAILQAGVKVRFYNIKEDLEADILDIQRKIDNTAKVLFVIHYFGFPQPLESLKDLCAKNGMFLIEDCAHALFSRYQSRPLGTIGDIAIFSFRKSLPLPDGGAMVVSDRLSPEPYLTKNPAVIATLRGIVLLACERLHMFKQPLYSLLELCVVRPAKLLLKNIKKIFHNKTVVTIPDSMDFDVSLLQLGISKMSRSILQEADETAIIEKRRENYAFLYELLREEKGVRIIFDELPTQTCPLFFPILVTERDELQKKLKELGINTFIFGKSLHALLPRNDFYNAQYFADHNLCLPIHQDIEREHIIYMAKVLKALSNNRLVFPKQNKNVITEIVSLGECCG